MRYYVIINGVNSLTIEGLAIRTLPPISKPAMRNIREEIDGRNGDITTELGYGAYDKTLEIGLYGAYDINKIISFFNSKGKIIFSDEPDKYYNFEIVDKIDYTKLVKFRTATINIHCQPFKYPVSEEPQVEEYEYVEATGTNVTLDNTSEAIFNKIDLLGNTSQNGTPTPSSPIPINVVSGDNEINICGKNLANPSDIYDGYPTGSNGGAIGFNPSANSITYKKCAYVVAGQPYTLSWKINTIKAVGSRDIKIVDNNNIILENFSYSNANNNRTRTFTPTYSGWVYAPLDTNATEVQIEKGSSASTYEPYIGNSYPISLPVENLFDKDNVNLLNGMFINASSGKIESNANTTSVYIPINPNTTYCVSKTKGNRFAIGYSSTTPAVNVSLTNIVDDRTKTSLTSTSSSNSKYLVIYISLSDTETYENIISTIQVEKGSKANSFTPYGKTPIELCKIGNYQDYIYKDNGSWYLHKEIGKVVLDGSESWQNAGTNPQKWSLAKSDYKYVEENICFSNYFRSVVNGSVGMITNNQIKFRYHSDQAKWLYICDTSFSAVADFKTWLSTHNTIVYYVLATPTNTEIIDTTLINQLEAIKNAISYNGQTNISQTNNDMPFILDLSALKEGSDHLVINNAGNIYAKPTMDLEGTGVVDIYLNDVQILEADLTETNNIVIDTESMEAYNPDTNALANRQVTGDYSKIKLEPGENDLRFSGDLSKATVTKYKRWL